MHQILWLGLQLATVATPNAGEVFRDCVDCPEMVIVPAGSFIMGTDSSIPSRATETPSHLVTIEKPFAVGRYEVTFAEWDVCVAEGGCSYSPDEIGWRGPDEPGWARGNHPVFRVNWTDTQTYIKWLSGKTGQTYRLLTEAEWEYMARAGTTTEFHTGDTITEEQANIVGRKRSRLGRQEVNAKIKALPVDTFPPNQFGIYNVHGGEMEWTQDCWHENYLGAPTDGSAWIKNADCSARVIRGGNWANTYRAIRSTGRMPRSTDFRSVSWGFRLARDLE